ncbi:MAG: hypothetical protein V4640_07525 [Verrucomicrobiota bacterium]
MILAWDHISARFLRRLKTHQTAADQIESIRLLAIHDAVISILGHGQGFIFHENSTGTSLAAALAASAQASHDILASAFDAEDDHNHLADALAESLSLISDQREKAVGAATGAASAAAFVRIFGSKSLSLRQSLPSTTIHGARVVHPQAHETVTPGIAGWRRSA